ncbi:MAG: hypothetical protein H0V10_02120, partial [Geodermatophilaceae bacterium]|nr:hypothetical protein [Geodermatophilaceae bacterium]
DCAAAGSSCRSTAHASGHSARFGAAHGRAQRLLRTSSRPYASTLDAAVFPGPPEALPYDLQQLGRATVVGERTRGGAHPRRGFRVHAHLEATIPVARAVSPISGSNWEGSGLTPDVECRRTSPWRPRTGAH